MLFSLIDLEDTLIIGFEAISFTLQLFNAQLSLNSMCQISSAFISSIYC